MPVSLRMLSLLLDELELKYATNEERGSIEFSLEARVFKNEEGEGRLVIVIRPGDEGKLVRLMAPALYRLPDGEKALAAAKGLLWATGIARFCKYSLDLEDGTISASATVPIGEGSLLPGQLEMLLVDLRDAIDYLHPVIQTAIDEGRIVLPDREKDEVDELLAAIGKMPPDQLRAIRESLAHRNGEQAVEEQQEVL